MTNPNDNNEFQQFLAWKNSGSPATGYVAPERELPTFAEVLKTLVNRAGLPSEQIVNDYHTVIDRYFEDKEPPVEDAQPDDQDVKEPVS